MKTLILGCHEKEDLRIPTEKKLTCIFCGEKMFTGIGYYVGAIGKDADVPTKNVVPFAKECLVHVVKEYTKAINEIDKLLNTN